MNKKHPVPGRPPVTYMELSRLLRARLHEFSLQSLFKYGYRNKEDISNLPPSTLVVGSQNVLTNAAEQVGIRQGYVLDGPAGNQNTYGIDSSYDFETSTGLVRNLRKWGSALEVRYVNPATSAVTWVSLMSTLIATNKAIFARFFDTNGEVKPFCLFVNGDNNVWEWSGGVASVSSVTATTVTVQGTTPIGSLGFYTSAANAGKQALLINGAKYTYTGTAGTTSNPFSQTPTNNKTTITTTQWFSQQFTTGGSATQVYQATLKVNSTAGSSLTSNFTASIYTDNAGVPGTLVGTSVNSSLAGVYAAGDFTITFSWPTPVTVSSATLYHLVVSSDQTGTDLEVYTGNTGAVGTNKSTNSGTTWGAVNGYLNATVSEYDTANSTRTFTGVSPSPVGLAVSGDAIVQPPVVGTTTAGINTSPNGTAFPGGWVFDLIADLENQMWYGSTSSNLIWVSATANYKDVSFGTSLSTVRLPAQGAFIQIDSPLVGFSPQGQQMYASAGRDQWWVSQKQKLVVAINNVATQTELLFMGRLKTALNQGAQSQQLIARFKNSLVYVSNEQIVNALGLVKNIFGDPQVVNMSDPIKYDIDAYDFTGGQVFYDDYFIFITIPKSGLVRMYNVDKKYWEAPQIIPIASIYHVTAVTPGAIRYGHSSSTNESYQLFTGYNDNGNPISAIAAFPYVSSDGGTANMLKSFSKIFTEGYLSSNTNLMLTINYDFGGFAGTYTTLISGTDKRILFNPVTDGSLGQQPLGSQPIGTILNLPTTPAIPKFRVIDTMPRLNFFESQLVFSTDDVDQQWALLRFGPAIAGANDIPNFITE